MVRTASSGLRMHLNGQAVVSPGPVSRCPSMTKILSRALVLAAVAGIAALAAAAPALAAPAPADPTPSGLLGDMGWVDTFGQNQGDNSAGFETPAAPSPHIAKITPAADGDAPLIDVTHAVGSLNRPLLAI